MPIKHHPFRNFKIIIEIAIYMKYISILFITIISSNILLAQSNSKRISFDANWLFSKGNYPSAEQPNFDDSKWRKLSLPHDWSIEDLPNQIKDSIVGPFNKGAIGTSATGFMVGGTAWYRKRFITEKSMEYNRWHYVSILFDGVYMNADVWINGNHLGNHPYGYTGFEYELYGYLNPVGKENVIAVRVRNEGKNSRWYSGSGIYRHVWLNITEKAHIATNGIYITTPSIEKDKAIVRIQTKVNNESLDGSWQISVATSIIAPNGTITKTTDKKLSIERESSDSCIQNITVPIPALWSVENPQLYKVVTEIKQGDYIIDKVITPFGIRSIDFSASKGFLLNGKKVLLKGGCIHHDNGPLGAAVYARAEERKIQLLKQNGYNAIRTSHNPPSPELLEACDRLGMLVIDEAFDIWEQGKNPEDYHLYFKDWWQTDLDAIILRDRSHPSVILWSIGNEIPERVDSIGLITTKKLSDRVHLLDPTRPVTEAINSFWDHPTYAWDKTIPTFGILGVGGYNYQFTEYENDHQKSPDRIMIGTESFPMQALENWDLVEKHPYVLGDFVWTAIDYLGEASIGHSLTSSEKVNPYDLFLGWPWFNAWCGDLDLIGNKKAQSYYRDVVWRQSPIAMAVHKPIPDGMKETVDLWGWPEEFQSWTWPGSEGKQLQARVFSRAPIVRLKLNSTTLAEQKMEAGKITANFSVTYQPGKLTAVNVIDGKETDTIEFKTTGAPEKIQLSADKTSISTQKSDISYVMVQIADHNNQVVPNTEKTIHFSITGEGEIVAVGSANPKDMASFQKPDRKTWDGKCLVIVRSKGKEGNFTLTAKSEGLKSAQIQIQSH